MIGLPLPFENIEISNEIYLGANNNLEEEAERYFDYIINAPNLLVKGRENISSFHSPYMNFDEYYWYNLQTGVKIPVDREYVRVELTLWSEKAKEEVNIYFGQVDINYLNNNENDSVPSMIIYPKKVEVIDENTRLRGNTTKELILDMCGGIDNFEFNEELNSCEVLSSIDDTNKLKEFKVKLYIRFFRFWRKYYVEIIYLFLSFMCLILCILYVEKYSKL